MLSARSIRIGQFTHHPSAKAGDALLTAIAHFSYKKIDTSHTKVGKLLSEDFLEF